MFNDSTLLLGGGGGVPSPPWPAVRASWRSRLEADHLPCLLQKVLGDLLRPIGRAARLLWLAVCHHRPRTVLLVPLALLPLPPQPLHQRRVVWCVAFGRTLALVLPVLTVLSVLSVLLVVPVRLVPLVPLVVLAVLVPLVLLVLLELATRGSWAWLDSQRLDRVRKV
jgi:hypothetical protein